MSFSHIRRVIIIKLEKTIYYMSFASNYGGEKRGKLNKVKMS